MNAAKAPKASKASTINSLGPGVLERELVSRSRPTVDATPWNCCCIVNLRLVLTWYVSRTVRLLNKSPCLASYSPPLSAYSLLQVFSSERIPFVLLEIVLNEKDPGDLLLANMQLPPKSYLATLPPPNYINPERHPPATSIVNLIMLPLCTIVVALRIFSRVRVSKSFGADDILIIVAMVRDPLAAAKLLLISLIHSFQLLLSRSLAFWQNLSMDGIYIHGMYRRGRSNWDCN